MRRRIDTNDRVLRIPEDLGGGRISHEPISPVRHYLKPEPIIQDPVMQTFESNSVTHKTIKVTDEQGMPLPGAHVYFDHNSGETTNFDGFASLSSSDADKIVTISYVGFQPQRFPLNDLPSVVQLTPGEILDEVVVTAPGKDGVPKYLFPAIGGVALLLILMASSGGSSKPQIVKV